MIANVTMPDGTIERMTLPKPIIVNRGIYKKVYVGRRTARIVVECCNGQIAMINPNLHEWIIGFLGIESAIDAVKEPRPL